MEIMIRHIKVFLPILAVIFISLNCKKKETAVSNLSSTEKNIAIKSNVTGNDSPYTIWKFASNNLNQSYKDYALYISEDSIKIVNSGQIVCTGEIVKEKETFSSYFKSSKTGNEIREQLKNEFAIKATDDLLVIMNADGDISKKGCQFPFNEMFIVGGYLFFYKDGYHSFVADNTSTSHENKGRFKFSNVKLPYQKKIDIKNVKYNKLSVKDIPGLSEFACGEEEIRYIPLEEMGKMNLILIPMDCGDAPYRYYLLSILNNKVISNLYVEGELYEPENNKSPETTSFSINSESVLTVKTINKDFQGKNVEKRYTITDQGKIIENK
ncbi:MAG: hypothetical protein MUW56_13140 [Chryseobacterium sp.]|uniref:hypothetical protein n=1 Tax=Chryseobacterium sp. TaxID=1871047 RepID=UPI0025BCFE88|nr:hypothetical protein [Chryseobacterium sp.]MCJ7934539.1 hypothetical protein [Chryseobacterium sp.]